MMQFDPVLYHDWHPVMRAELFTDGTVQKTCLLGVDVVLWQAAGVIHAMRDLCVHRGAKLSLGKIVNDCIMCPYHGWQYDASGQCVHMPAHPEQTPPAKARTDVYQVSIRYNLVWVCLGEPTKAVPPFPEWDEAGYGHAVCGPFGDIKAHGPRLIENFLDAAHFPFVHEGVLGDPTRPTLGDYEARITADGVESDPIEVYQPDPYGGIAGRVTYTYHAYRPYTAHFTKHMPAATNGMVMTLTPHDDGVCSVWFLVATSAVSDHATLETNYTPRIAAILAEDVAVVESQRPELLPLDMQAELHLRSDRVAIAYRRWLAQLGLKAGVA
jgi:phenylpropionate dioxygenase-like ring-hydroxylating dioxygenase large terminal subunit